MQQNTGIYKFVRINCGGKTECTLFVKFWQNFMCNRVIYKWVGGVIPIPPATPLILAGTFFILRDLIAGDALCLARGQWCMHPTWLCRQGINPYKIKFHSRVVLASEKQ